MESEQFSKIMSALATLNQSIGQVDGNDVQVVNSVVLNSTKNQLALQSNYYYSVTFLLVGSVSADVSVDLTPIAGNTANQIGNFFINNTLTGYRIEGVQLQAITVNKANIGSASVYVGFVGYTKPIQPHISIV